MNVLDVPIGIRILQKITCLCAGGRIIFSRDFWYRLLILVLTFLSYTAYHLSRKPISVVKNVLNRNCSLIPVPSDVNTTDPTWCDWAPFDGDNAQTLLGALDSSFLFAYAIGMFISGVVAERNDLRYFLASGMLLSGIFTYMFGLGYTLGIHNLYYYLIVQALAGFSQSTGWPGVVTAIGHWFGKGKRGLIFGIWNSHTSIGNILGTLIAAYYIEINWGLAFMYPGLIIAAIGILVFLFLVPDPRGVGCTPPDHHGTEDTHTIYSPAERSRLEKQHYGGRRGSRRSDGDNEKEALLSADSSDNAESSIASSAHLIGHLPADVSLETTVSGTSNGSLRSAHHTYRRQKAIGFLQAIRIPGVIEFSFCLFFAKLISYTFLYWLPRYIKASTSFTASESANLSTLFDVGGILGGILAGVMTDHTGMSAVTCAVMLLIAIPMLFLYQLYGAVNLATSMILLVVVGLFVNGPYALITTAVSTELGTHKCLKGSARAVATVTAIIDGTGSVGAAVGPFLAGPISELGWEWVFYMLMASDVLALLFLSRVVKHDIERWFSTRQSRRTRRSQV
ncbi:glucose-6-phosphate exchanger SLC37A2-like isoform X2 [Artemia franciscana]|uniref:Sugar phosphate exchanger 3 n=1 Tax=Artemia franciscana TaxID=6661 RepID=A0AA88HL29_ARTSF|nr:hypothetical protein QYM36_013321 [Artemia franciscana]